MSNKQSLSEVFLMDTFSDTMYLILYAAGHNSHPHSGMEVAFHEVAVYNFLEGFENVLASTEKSDKDFAKRAQQMLELELGKGSHFCQPGFEANLFMEIIDKEIFPNCYNWFKQSVDKIKFLLKLSD